MDSPPPNIKDFRQIIDLWPTRSAFDRDLKMKQPSPKAGSAAQWYKENRIPEKWFDNVLVMAQARGYGLLTYPVLSRLYRQSLTEQEN